mmetsp:Transcript_80203/g.141555  ORF Transcript_80203/g.141555 Transcript_80203/m.141555 type:complete len:200 (-) Transcript_80203:454-1053(-)
MRFSGLPPHSLLLHRSWSWEQQPSNVIQIGIGPSMAHLSKVLAIQIQRRGPLHMALLKRLKTVGTVNGKCWNPESAVYANVRQPLRQRRRLRLHKRRLRLHKPLHSVFSAPLVQKQEVMAQCAQMKEIQTRKVLSCEDSGQRRLSFAKQLATMNQAAMASCSSQGRLGLVVVGSTHHAPISGFKERNSLLAVLHADISI